MVGWFFFEYIIQIDDSGFKTFSVCICVCKKTKKEVSLPLFLHRPSFQSLLPLPAHTPGSTVTGSQGALQHFSMYGLT